MTFQKGWAPRHQNQVIGESYADGAFIQAVAAAHGVPAFDFTAPEKDGVPQGKDQFRQHLNGMQTFIRRGMVSRIVVVGDNDTSHADAVATIRRAIKEAKDYPSPPVSPCERATNGKVTIGFVTLPETGHNGCLETLLLRATMNGGPTTQCVDDWVACNGFPATPQNNYHKFRIRSILAAAIRDDPNITLKRIWSKTGNPINPGDPAFTWIATFLREVFV